MAWSLFEIHWYEIHFFLCHLWIYVTAYVSVTMACPTLSHPVTFRNSIVHFASFMLTDLTDIYHKIVLKIMKKDTSSWKLLFLFGCISQILYNVMILYYIVLYCIILYYIVLNCIILYYIVSCYRHEWVNLTA